MNHGRPAQTWTALVASIVLGFPVIASANPTTKPNVVIVLADDLGVECLSSYGGTSHKTPNIDKLATQGMRFTRCFSNPYCSPSRASLLTGRYPFKNGLKTVLDTQDKENVYLHPDQPSFARQLKQQDTRRSWSANGTCPSCTSTTRSTSSDLTSISAGGSSMTRGEDEATGLLTSSGMER